MRVAYNFAAGPAQLPLPVLEQIQAELLDWHSKGVSILEMGHRTPEFMQILAEVKQSLYSLTEVSPEDYDFIFLAGGARMINALVPMNLPGKADYVCSGFWSKTSYEQGMSYAPMRIAATSEAVNQAYPAYHWAVSPEQWDIDPEAAFVHYCHNETLSGVAYSDIPKLSVPVVTDMTSCFLSQKQSWQHAGIVYAGAQKNLGIAGLSVVMIRRDLLGRASDICPNLGNFTRLSETNSLLNTPPVFAIYVLGLVLKYLQSLGGMNAIGEMNHRKSQLLYAFIDNSGGFYRNHVAPENRSICNVSFRMNDALLETFLTEAKSAGLANLKGHSMVGGLRASLYNAMPIEGVQALIDFMGDFEKRYG